jgi:hypothetical protein
VLSAFLSGKASHSIPLRYRTIRGIGDASINVKDRYQRWLNAPASCLWLIQFFDFNTSKQWGIENAFLKNPAKRQNHYRCWQTGFINDSDVMRAFAKLGANAASRASDNAANIQHRHN